MNNLWTDTGYISLNHVNEQLCGDRVEIIGNNEKSLTMVLADGLGSGVKANILSTLTSKIICTMMANGMPIEECVDTIAKTLPVCSVRQVAYSTFTIIRITDNTTAEIIQFDNPNVILLRNGKSVDYPIVSRVIEGKTILESRIPLQLHDVFIAMSDGAIYAGVGKTMNFGWQRENIIEYAERLYDDTLSAKMIASMIVDECNRSWCSSSNANDQRAITIECASDKAEPYAMKSAVYEKLIKLCADICKRNGKTKVLWLGSKEKALTYEPKANEIVLTAHRWFANKSCPGDWLYSRYGELADRINALLGSTDSGNSGGNNTPSGGSGVKYYVQTGAYKQKANADAQLKKVKAAGFDAILKQSGDFYKVQTGAYSKKENANAEVAKLKAKGFDAIVTTNGGSAAGSTNSEIKVGDVVQFSGGPHYGSAAASTAAGTPKAGPAKVTRIVKGAKHPYHIVHTDSQSSVYGWVNAANVSK